MHSAQEMTKLGSVGGFPSPNGAQILHETRRNPVSLVYYYYDLPEEKRQGLLAHVEKRLGLLLKLDQVLDSVVHLLDGLELGQTQTSLVGDVINSSLRVGVLSVDTADLELKSIADGLEVGLG